MSKLAFFLVPIIGIAQASAAPDPASVRSVWDFFYDAEEGVILGDAKLCLEIAKEGSEKNNCAVEVPEEGVEKGTTVIVWNAYLVPTETEVDDLAIQVKHEGVVRQTRDLSIKGAWRYRTWKNFRLNKTGNWTFTMLKGSEELETLTVAVN